MSYARIELLEAEVARLQAHAAELYRGAMVRQGRGFDITGVEYEAYVEISLRLAERQSELIALYKHMHNTK